MRNSSMPLSSGGARFRDAALGLDVQIEVVVVDRHESRPFVVVGSEPPIAPERTGFFDALREDDDGAPQPVAGRAHDRGGTGSKQGIGQDREVQSEAHFTFLVGKYAWGC